MKFKVDPKIFEKFPKFIAGIIFISDLKNTKDSEKEDLLEFLRGHENNVRLFLDTNEIDDLSAVKNWREMFQSFGSKPSKFKSSIEALLRREKDGEDLPDINPLVNFYNALSLNYKVSFGAEDLDTIVGDIDLTFAGKDTACQLISEKEPSYCDEGEVVYKDKIGAICRKWCWREANRTKITKDTKNAFFVIEFNDGDLANAEKVISETVDSLIYFFDVQTQSWIVDKDNPEIEIPFETKTVGEPLVVKEKEKTKDKGQKTKVKRAEYKLKPGIEKKLYDVLALVIKEKFGEEYVDALELEHPAEFSHGDFATNIAMKLAGKLKKNPREIAQEIFEELNPLVKGILKEGGEVTRLTYFEFPTGLLEKVEIAGSGFINFFIGKESLISEFKNTNDTYGQSNWNNGKRYMVEFSQPNPMKAFHIGHLKGTLYGESLARILEATGIEVKRANYQGDVGLHIAKIMWAALQDFPARIPAEIADKSLDERVDFIQKLYVKGASAYKDDEAAKVEIDKINKEVNDGAEYLQPYYQTFRQWSIDKFDEIYKRLDTHFDRYFYESETIKPSSKYVQDAIEKGILEKEETGSVVFRGEDYGLHTRVFINKFGQPTYEAKDLHLGYMEATEFGSLDKHLFLIGAEQKDYLQVVFKVRELLFGDLLKDKQEHVVNGFVNLKGMKMSSRLGNVVKGEDVIKMAKDKIIEILKSRDYTEEEKENIAEKLALASVKYSFLKNNPNKDSIFDLEESVSTEGNSGPYVMYSYTRAKSILRDNTGVIPDLIGDLDSRLRGNDTRNLFETDSEMAVLRTLYKFPETVINAAENYAPNYIADFIFDLAQKFNSFYRECPVLTAENEEFKNSRLLLTSAAAQVLENGLRLLGIETVERM